VRLALGAEPRTILRMVLARGMRYVIVLGPGRAVLETWPVVICVRAVSAHVYRCSELLVSSPTALIHRRPWR